MAAAAAHGEAPKSKKPIWHGLGFQVIVGMLLGALLGAVWPTVGEDMKILGDIFLRLVKTIVAPLVFLTVTLGIVGAHDSKSLGKIGGVSLLYFEVISSIALLWGMGTGILTGVGKGINLSVPLTEAAVKGAAAAEKAAAGGHATLSGFFLNIFPESLIGAFAEGEVLQVLVLAVLFAFALKMLKANQRDAISDGLNLLTQAMYKFTHLIMNFAPIGAFGAIAFATATNGSAVLIALSYWVGIYWATQIAFIVVVLGGSSILFGINIFNILRYIKDEIFVVLGTASSETVLPRLLEKLPAYGVTPQTAGLVLPTGYVFNLAGASIYISMAVIFLANAYNIELSFAHLATILGVMLVTSKGVATVTGGSFIVFTTTVAATGLLPLEGLPIMFGVYRIMAPANSTCNAISNAVATVVIAKICGEYDPTRRVPVEDLEV